MRFSVIFKSFLVLALVVTATLSAEETATKESTAFEALTGANTPLKKGEVIAFFGDSITAAGARKGGYCNLLASAIAASHPELEVKPIYAGISGHKVPNLQGRLERDVLSKNPTVVFIYIGINDVWHGKNGTPKDKFDEGLRDLIKKISDAGATVVLATPSVIGEKTDGTNKLDSLLDEYADISRKVAKDTGVTMCDLRGTFLARLKEINPENKERGLLTGDTVHLNAAGNQFVAEQAAKSIAAALKKRK
ncbi:MAG: lysophospholipase L1-like esterase [Pirellulaceae bacterium]|jgi:lysophospholipase L1-like esterase